MILDYPDGPTLSKGSYEKEAGGSEFKGRKCDRGTREEGLRERERERERQIVRLMLLLITLTLKMEGARSQGMQAASMN